MIRRVLRGLKEAGRVEALGRGRGRSGGKEVVPLKRGNREGNVMRGFVVATAAETPAPVFTVQAMRKAMHTPGPGLKKVGGVK